MDRVIKQLAKKLLNQKVLIACSTGVDSMVLLHLVMKVKDVSQIIVAHVNHQKREQSEIEEKYIKQFCSLHHMKCYTFRLPPIQNGNFQSEARKKRYDFFNEIADKEEISYILLAHHADDNLETILMRLMKSSSLKGYAGIEEETKFKNHILYRPLLETPKKDIVAYAKQNQIVYFEDASNQELDYTRNRIRHLITPILLEENPNLYQAIHYFSETILNANEKIEKEEFLFIENQIVVNNNDNKYTYILKIADYQTLSSFMQKQVLFRLLKKYHLSHTCIEDIQKQIESCKAHIVTKINSEIAMIKEYGNILFTEEAIEPIQYYQKIEEEGRYELPNHVILEVNKNSCNFITPTNNLCYNIECLPIIVRNRMAGDKIGTKLVSDMITNRKIPYRIRKNLLLLCDKENKILAILGYKGGK